MNYVVTEIADERRQYDSKYGRMCAYKVLFEGQSETVEISQKLETPAPKVGDSLEGTIQDTEYGKKFKKDFARRPGGSGSYTKDDAAIKAMWSIGQAIAAIKSEDVKAIESLAKQLFAMVDRVKDSKEEAPF